MHRGGHDEYFLCSAEYPPYCLPATLATMGLCTAVDKRAVDVDKLFRPEELPEARKAVPVPAPEEV